MFMLTQLLAQIQDPANQAMFEQGALQVGAPPQCRLRRQFAWLLRISSTVALTYTALIYLFVLHADVLTTGAADAA